MKDLTEEVDREKVGREEAVKTAKEKMKTVESAKKRVAASEKSRASTEKRLVELVRYQNETEVKLAKAASKWYDKRFADAKKGMEPVVMQARQLSF